MVKLRILRWHIFLVKNKFLVAFLVVQIRKPAYAFDPDVFLTV